MHFPESKKEWSFVLEDPERTFALGSALVQWIDSPGVVAFFGGLGAGKTTFVQALGAGLGLKAAITSPTYTIINRYAGGRMSLVHVDCYRLEREDELYDLGLEELFAGDSLVCVEWAEKAAGLLPSSRLEIHLANLSRQRRGVNLVLYNALWPRIGQFLPPWLERNL